VKQLGLAAEIGRHLGVNSRAVGSGDGNIMKNKIVVLKSMKWLGPALAVLAVIGYAVGVRDASCVETKYSGGWLVECDSTTIFRPGQPGVANDSESAGIDWIPLPPGVIGLFGALFHGECETTMIPEGQWTSCRDGFSLLQRDGGAAAWALRLKTNEDAANKAVRSRAREDIDDPVEDSDCGRYPCSSHFNDDDDPERGAYLDSLWDYQKARLAAVLRAWERQEIERDLEQARAENTALHERLKQIAEYEAQLEHAEALAQVDPESVGQGRK
jgi:hypothetical protein